MSHSKLSGWIYQVYANAIKRFAPKKAVQKSLKNSPNGILFLLGDSEKELPILGDLSAVEIGKRFWSLQTRLELIKAHNYCLVGDCSTVDEFSLILNTGNEELIKRGLKSYTPNKEMTMRLLTENNHLVSDYMMNNLTAREILGIGEKQRITEEEIISPRGKRLMGLVKGSSKRALELLEIVKSTAPKRNVKPEEAYTPEVRKAFSIAWQVAVKKGENLQEFLAYTAVFFKREFLYLLATGADTEKYICKIYPQLVSNLDPTAVQEFLADKELNEAMLTDGIVSMMALSAATQKLKDTSVWQVVFNSFPIIQKKLENMKEDVKEVVDELKNELIENAQTSHQLKAVLKLADAEEKEELQKKFVKVLLQEMEGNVTRPNIEMNLLPNFPFKNWEDAEASKAVKHLVRTNLFPTARIGELAENLQNFAKTCLEEYSEIEALKKGHGIELVEKSLHPGTEIELVSNLMHYSKYAMLYNDAFQINPTALSVLIKKGEQGTANNPLSLSFLRKYAAKWGLNEEQYLLLLQSSFKEYGYSLKPYIRK